MNWRSRFNGVFFALWREHGLASGRGHAERYDALRSTFAAPQMAPIGGTGPLAPKTLFNVHGFGAIFGWVVAGLLGTPESEAMRRAGWCGRFNLGISLFDWLCDEAGRLDELLTASPFCALAGHGSGDVERPPADATEALLRNLATGLLAEMEAEVGPDGPHADALWRDMAEMLAAETEMARARLAPTPDLDAWLEAARLKSAGPFRCMAEWVSLGTDTNRESAARLGTALGDGYWLVDDARDLWEDLDAGRWNLFLLAAAKTEPGLLEAHDDPDFEFRLGQILLRPGWVEGLVAPALEEIVARLEEIGATPAARVEAEGLVATSMERWLS